MKTRFHAATATLLAALTMGFCVAASAAPSAAEPTFTVAAMTEFKDALSARCEDQGFALQTAGHAACMKAWLAPAGAVQVADASSKVSKPKSNAAAPSAPAIPAMSMEDFKANAIDRCENRGDPIGSAEHTKCVNDMMAPAPASTTAKR